MAARPSKPKAAGPSPADWRAATLAEVRRLIAAADPAIVEEAKRITPTKPAGVPVWGRGGIVCTAETYKRYVRLIFPKGATLPAPAGLFNGGDNGASRRAICLREGDALDATAFQALVRAAVAENLRHDPAPAGPVKLLSGGNPQIAKADGDAPVQAYIAAMPGWKGDLGRRLDKLIVDAVPDVRKAVRWNSPFYGVEGMGWILSFHVLTKYVKVTFFAGTSLDPVPPGGTAKSKAARWLDIYETDAFDGPQMAAWVRQAATVRGWVISPSQSGM